MNFFEHQDQARRQSRWLVILFLLSLVGVSLGIGMLTYLLGGINLAIVGAISTLLIMLLASGYKILSLRQGGGQVARAMRGTLVDPNTQDPLRRRLYNVVEEMAIASGVPVPEVYVLEQETAINAFAAGYTPHDAAVAVTRGLLESLDRDELQGVVAHEFSHIVNGDMRINIRLMSFVFGIMIISLLGQHLMHSARFTKNSKDAAPLVIFSLLIVMIGWIGLFFGRVIKAAISRQREYLADAAAVQFTRHPQGIGNALKKIELASSHSYLEGGAEEVAHMLFGANKQSWLLATHPPLIKRIQAIEPNFTLDDLKDFKRALSARAQSERAAQEAQAEAQSLNSLSPFGEHLWLNASVLLLELPDGIKALAHSDQAIEALLTYLLCCEHWMSSQPLQDWVESQKGAQLRKQVDQLIEEHGILPLPARLPVFEMVIPSLRRRPLIELESLGEYVSNLIMYDGVVSVFEYSLDRLMTQAMEAIRNPSKVRIVGDKSLESESRSVAELLAVIAVQGHGALDEQQAAWHRGLESLETQPHSWPQIKDWMSMLDAVIPRLNQLSAHAKARLAQAMVDCIAWDGDISAEEYALCRTLAGLLSIPLPLDYHA